MSCDILPAFLEFVVCNSRAIVFHCMCTDYSSYSTESALHRIKTDVDYILDQEVVGVMVLLDLSVSF